MNRAEIQAWIEAYGRAWRERDSAAAVRLFTEQAVYRSSPFREPSMGSDGIRAYWERATGDQRGLELRFGDPVADGPRVAVEWWATLEDREEGPATLPGALILRFAPDGRCEELREYWHLQKERVPPPAGWGR